MLQESGAAPDAALRQAAHEITSCMAVLPSVSLRTVRTDGASARIAGTKEGNWDREVLVDPGFLEEAKRGAGSDWPVYFMVAHELGHHVKGHLEPGGLLSRVSAGRAERHAAELEADRMAGFVLYKLGASRQEVQRALYTRTEAGSETHPPLAERRGAALAGWREASEQGPPPPGCAANVTQVVARWSFDENPDGDPPFFGTTVRDGYLWLENSSVGGGWTSAWTTPKLRELRGAGLSEAGDFSFVARMRPVALAQPGVSYGVSWKYPKPQLVAHGDSLPGTKYELILDGAGASLTREDQVASSWYETLRERLREEGKAGTPDQVLEFAKIMTRRFLGRLPGEESTDSERRETVTGDDLRILDVADPRILDATDPTVLEPIFITSSSSRVVAQAMLDPNRREHILTLRKSGTRMQVLVDGDLLHEYPYRSLMESELALIAKDGAHVAVDEVVVLQH